MTSKSSEARKEYNRRYYSANKQRILENSADYYQRTKHTRALQRSAAKLKTKYGMTLNDYELMWSAQGEKCAVCGTMEIPAKGYWHIDHCHETGKVRGILCHHCNVGLGHFRDDADRLRLAIAYLRRDLDD